MPVSSCFFDTTTVSIIDMTDPSFPVVGTTDIHQVSSDIDITSDNKYLCATNWAHNTLSIIDLTKPSFPLVGVTNVGTQPYFVAITPDNKYACVANTGDSSISIIDLTNSTFPVVGTPTVGANPLGIAIANFTSPPDPPAPPAKVKGIVQKHHPFNKAKLWMQWKKSPSPDVVAYEVLAFSKVLATIPASGPLKFHKYLHSPFLVHSYFPSRYRRRLRKKYFVRAVNAAGLASTSEKMSLKVQEEHR